MYYLLVHRTNFIVSVQKSMVLAISSFYWKMSQGVICPGALTSIISCISEPLLCHTTDHVMQSLRQSQGQQLYWACGQWLSCTCAADLMLPGSVWLHWGANCCCQHLLLAIKSSQGASRINCLVLNKGNTVATEVSFCFPNGSWCQSRFLGIMFKLIF